MQFEPQMLEPDGMEQMRALSRTYSVGVWNHAHRDPDNLDTVQALVHGCGVSFVNSDLPRNFVKGGALTPQLSPARSPTHTPQLTPQPSPAAIRVSPSNSRDGLPRIPLSTSREGLPHVRNDML
mmetsp:Transcript_11929/g.37928  ORF Transcript_11929/g.37928 Transcript_11929/m.37928 type:complete len:124 (-) Transcript_11929:771-1142(-)